MSVTLEEIIRHKRREVDEAMKATPIEAFRERIREAPPARNFFGSVANGRGPSGFNVIAEVKERSPSAGTLRDPYDPAACFAPSFLQAQELPRVVGRNIQRANRDDHFAAGAQRAAEYFKPGLAGVIKIQ